jgi:copper chaperone CopZ
MSRKNFIAGKGFSVEDNDGIVVSFLEANDGRNIDLKNITSVEVNHSYDLDNSKKNNYILIATTSLDTQSTNLTLGNYATSLYPQLPSNSINFLKANIVAINRQNTDKKYSINYESCLLCSNDVITEISNLQTIYIESFPQNITWSVSPYFSGNQVSFTCVGNPVNPSQAVKWVCNLEIVSSTFSL